MLSNKTLPYKVALKVFSYMDVKTLCNTCLVCKSWKFLAESDPLWKEIVTSRWDIPPNEMIKNWRKAYQAKLVR
jgi:hypothetical protein